MWPQDAKTQIVRLILAQTPSPPGVHWSGASERELGFEALVELTIAGTADLDAWLDTCVDPAPCLGTSARRTG